MGGQQTPAASRATAWTPRAARDTAIDVLVHPVVLVALGVLLVNDHVLKSAHPGWITGKLSDLAWPLVATPLVGLVLAPVARWHERRSWALASALVVAIPLVTTNVSTNAATAAGRALSAVVGPSSVVADPTDLIAVVPALVLVTAMLVRRPAAAAPPARSAPRSTAGRRHLKWLHLALVGVATFGTAATSCDESNAPAVLAVTTQDGVVYADLNPSDTTSVEVARSHDEGRTWDRSQGPDPFSEVRQQHGGPVRPQPLRDPRCVGTACYRIIHGTVEARVDVTEWRTVWEPEHARAEVMERQRDTGACPESGPPAGAIDLVVVEGRSDTPTAVVAMGRDGVLTGDAEGGFVRIGVDRAQPPTTTALTWEVLGPELTAIAWIVAIAWFLGSFAFWFRLRRAAIPGQPPPRPGLAFVFAFGLPALLSVPLIGSGLLPFFAVVAFLGDATFLARPALLMTAWPVLGWIAYRTPNGCRHVPWRLAARILLAGSAVTAPFVAWAGGLVTELWVANALALAFLPIAIALPAMTGILTLSWPRTSHTTRLRRWIGATDR